MTILPVLPASLKGLIEREAKTLGFSAARFAALPEVWRASDRLEAFVDAGYHGEMSWLKETLTRRQHPQNMWRGAKSALVLGYNYGPHSDPREALLHPDLANISVYARGDDYHELIKKKLKQLAGWVVQETHCELKVFVDTAPLMEKPLAELCGLGWQGKHTNLVSREFGSWLFLGVILLDKIIESDPTMDDHCGSCQACLDVCPTNAFVAPYRLDARKCLSYLTIELRGPWPKLYRPLMLNRIYGCDDCLAACPWNKFAQATHDLKLQARQGFEELRLVDLALLDDQSFRTLFSKSPIKRIGRESFVRNVIYALGNAVRAARDPNMLSILQMKLTDPSPVVRGAAVWSLRQGLRFEVFAKLRAQWAQIEADPTVRSEWDDADE